MNFLVLSRKSAIEFSYNTPTSPYIIISITDIGSEIAIFKESDQLKAVLRLNFNDTDIKTESGISSADAKQIVNFVKTWKNQVSLIVVHCEAGMARSAGVCAALMLWLNGDDSPIFDSFFYKPNMLCYRTVLNELAEAQLNS